jgi:hypothetical protein
MRKEDSAEHPLLSFTALDSGLPACWEDPGPSPKWPLKTPLGVPGVSLLEDLAKGSASIALA